MSESDVKQESPAMLKRLIDWNVEILMKLLKQVVAKREAARKGGWDDEPEIEIKDTILEEVADIIVLPPFDKDAQPVDPSMIEVPKLVASQLRDFVTAIAAAYRSNPYHCLQHASHVTMAVSKLISRIAASDFEGVVDESDANFKSELLAAHIHNQTYGIVSDPLAQFSVVLAALIHAVDHRGVSNEILTKEEPDLASKYKMKGLTEQLSFEKAWNKLMSPDFENLRRCIYGDAEEKKRFRQIMVNSVMATDCDDEEAQLQRRERWDSSFGPGASLDEDFNRKATSVIETLMQAADVFHTMQHWHIYVKWNERAFEEATVAHILGRIPTDPAKTWYKDQLNDFDNFVIPLAMQLKDIDAFVVCSDEYLNYALKNRQRWASNGRAIVAALVAKAKGSASAKIDLIKAISKEGKDEEASTKDAAASTHLQRLVDWNCEVLEQLLKQIQSKRALTGKEIQQVSPFWTEAGKTVVDEVAESIVFPEFDAASSRDKLEPGKIVLSDAVSSQLKEYVGHVSSQFRDNSFHCLDHASHVSMTAKKLLGRLIAAPPETSPEDAHKESFGLASDPLTQFAVVFAALIHDMDHAGVPNSQLSRENPDLANKYNNRSVAEQNCVDLAWNQLMQPEFEDLREAICADEEELKRFRQVVVNAVLATDFAEEGLVQLRKARVEKAASTSDDLNIKATIAISLILQAADVFHAIQHWQVFKKWSERNFFEVYAAFEKGRMDKDPSVYWYKSELLFLEEHVIPLCEQIKDLGVFGPSADEYLAFALTNREYWTLFGADLVQTFIDKAQGKEEKKSEADRVTQRMSLSAV